MEERRRETEGKPQLFIFYQSCLFCTRYLQQEAWRLLTAEESDPPPNKKRMTLMPGAASDWLTFTALDASGILPDTFNCPNKVQNKH